VFSQGQMEIEQNKFLAIAQKIPLFAKITLLLNKLKTIK
jgi:hypothetical protein